MEVHVDTERFTMVVIIVAETCCRRKVGWGRGRIVY